MNMWSEVMAGSGSNEIISALDTYFKSTQIILLHERALMVEKINTKNVIGCWYCKNVSNI